MKRLLLLAALLSLATPAVAKTLVVLDKSTWTDNPVSGPYSEQMLLRAVTKTLDARGATYRVVPLSVMKTNYARTGVVETGAVSDTFNAAIIVSYAGRTARPTSNFRSDSLTISRASVASGGLPLIPVLYVLNDALHNETNGVAGNVYVDGATSTRKDTLGVSGWCQAGSCSGSHEHERSLYVPGYPEAWAEPTYTATAVRNSTAPAGGIRTLLSASSNPQFLRLYWSNTYASDQDSIGRYSTQTNADSMLVWERPMAHVSGASSQLFAVINSALPSQDSLSNEPFQGGGVNESNLLLSLQRLDSLALGRVFDKIKPWTVSAVIRGAGNRSSRFHYIGIQEADSTTIKAYCDSLANLGIPITVGADPDSITAQELNWWRRAGRVKFTPYPRRGIDSVAVFYAGGGKSRSVYPVDYYGAWRNRFAYGPTSGSTAITFAKDTNSYSHVLTARNTLNDFLTEGEKSKALIFPLSDWTPKNVRRQQNVDMVDSLLGVFALAGYRAMVVDGVVPVQTQTGATVGWPMRPGVKTFPPIAGGPGQITVVAHSFTRIGGSKLTVPLSDSTMTGVASTNNLTTVSTSFWYGAMGGGDRDEQILGVLGNGTSNAFADPATLNYTPGPTSVILVGAADFGSAESSIHSMDAPGFWVIKRLVHASRAINRMGYQQRSLVVWVNPEDQNP